MTGTFGSLHPDFAGDALLFGLAQITGINGFAGHVTTQYQSPSFDIHLAAPEPGVLALVAAALLAMYFLRRRSDA